MPVHGERLIDLLVTACMPMLILIDFFIHCAREVGEYHAVMHTPIAIANTAIVGVSSPEAAFLGVFAPPVAALLPGLLPVEGFLLLLTVELRRVSTRPSGIQPFLDAVKRTLSGV